jgi:nitronate monooxygenase
MKTRITELFGIEHPVIQGGMHYVGLAEMAAAVSNAGGLGIITGLTQGTPEKLANEIKRCQAMTDKPFGVNLTFLPSVTPPDYPGLVNTIVESGVKVVETAGNNPAKWLPQLKEAGIKVIHKCTSVRHSVKAQDIGCDAVSVAVTLGKTISPTSFFCPEQQTNWKSPLLLPAVWPMHAPWSPLWPWVPKA